MEDVMNSAIRGWSATYLLLPFVVLMAVAPPGAQGQETHRISGSEVAVFNLAGAVEIVPGSGGDVTVEIMRGGSDASRLEVRTVRVDGWDALVIHYPGDEIVYPEMWRGSRTQTNIADDGTFFGDRGSRDRRVTISGSGDGMEAWADLRIAVPAGKQFGLFLLVGETSARDVTGDFLLDQGSGGIHVEGAGGRFMIDTGSGAVTVNGFDGDISVDTGSGSVEIHDVQGDDLMVDTGSGEVVGSQISASSVGIDTGSGEVALTRISSSNVMVDTGSGGVELELLSDVQRLEVDTGSGPITIVVPPNLGAEIEADTGSGGIDVDVPLEIREAERNYLRGVLGDGRGSIRIDTGSGEIRIISR
jgi:hypothetical protein